MMGLSQPSSRKEATMIAFDKEVAELAQLPTDERVRALRRIIPCSTIKAILKKYGHQRHCARVPKWFMVWFVIGVGLCSCDCYRQIYRWLQRFRGPGSTPGKSTLCEARQRLGVAPLRWLMDKIVSLRATAAMPGAFYSGMRLMALDGFIVDVADTIANEKAFGRPKNGHALGAFPQARVLALCEVGTHILWKCLIKPIGRAEIKMARTLLRFLAAGMLVLWDRGFLSYEHVAQVLSQKAHLLARVKTNLVFSTRTYLPDGSTVVKIAMASWCESSNILFAIRPERARVSVIAC
jgi:hypothetical protein